MTFSGEESISEPSPDSVATPTAFISSAASALTVNAPSDRALMVSASMSRTPPLLSDSRPPAFSDRSRPASTDTDLVPLMVTEPLLSTVISVPVRSRLIVSRLSPVLSRTPRRPPARWSSRSSRLPLRSASVRRTVRPLVASYGCTSTAPGRSLPL